MYVVFKLDIMHIYKAVYHYVVPLPESDKFLRGSGVCCISWCLAEREFKLTDSNSVIKVLLGSTHLDSHRDCPSA
jgi:hypothetical protein